MHPQRANHIVTKISPLDSFRGAELMNSSVTAKMAIDIMTKLPTSMREGIVLATYSGRSAFNGEYGWRGIRPVALTASTIVSILSII